MTGFVNIDKSEGCNSTRVVSVIKRLTHVQGCGHMGTLDPMASGVLPVGIGNATRLFDFFLAKRKTYVAEFAFGYTSDTLDTTGELVACGSGSGSGAVPAAEDIIAALPVFVGEIDQLPPKYSAKKVNGRRGYDLAREGKDFDLKPSKVTIYSFKLLGQNAEDPSRFSFEIECGGGTYIRSLARDLGEALGTGAVMSALKRTRSGPFTLENAVKLEELTEDNIENYIIPAESVLDMESIYVSGKTQFKLLNGVAVDLSGRSADVVCMRKYVSGPGAVLSGLEADLSDIAPDRGVQEGVYKLFLQDGSFYGLCEVKNNVMRVTKKLC